MMISRRSALLGGVCLAAVAGGVGFALLPGGIAAHARRVIARVYGSDIAAQPAAQAFCDGYETFLIEKGLSGQVANAIFNFKAGNLPYVEGKRAKLDRSIVVKFATSTNVVLSAETGVELEYSGVFHPIENSCSNQLSHLGLLSDGSVASAG
ncbi:hypothetical protein [Ruegeria arenilitoris]|uniref:hypothetical protein n=1 Tax=Ruegeria arenilitoris TaxID=1173585 RepID=UPI001479AA60|nr:hypothetical protein [Ruegeria arenilitoris]